MRALALAALLAAGCTSDPARAGGTESAPPAPAPPPADSAAPAASPDSPAASPDSPAAAPAAEPEAPAEAAPAPMRDWMNSSLARPVKHQDFAALERGLRSTADLGPAELAEWPAIAEGGARAAAARDIDGVRASCTTCHNKYRADYRKRMRARPLPETKDQVR